MRYGIFESGSLRLMQAEQPYSARCAAATSEQRINELAQPRAVERYTRRRQDAEASELQECTFAPKILDHPSSTPRRHASVPGTVCSLPATQLVRELALRTVGRCSRVLCAHGSLSTDFSATCLFCKCCCSSEGNGYHAIPVTVTRYHSSMCSRRASVPRA